MYLRYDFNLLVCRHKWMPWEDGRLSTTLCEQWRKLQVWLLLWLPTKQWQQYL